MSKVIPPPPPTVPIGRIGPNGSILITPEWAKYLTVDIFMRMGGYNAPTPQELQAEIDAVEVEVDELTDDVALLEAEVDELTTDTSLAVNFGTQEASASRIQQLEQLVVGLETVNSSLRADVDRLRTIVDGLTVGVQL